MEHFVATPDKVAHGFFVDDATVEKFGEGKVDIWIKHDARAESLTCPEARLES